MGSTIRDTQSDQTYDQPYDWPHDDWLPDHDFDRLPLSKICNNFFFPFEHRMRGRCRRWEHMRVPSHRRAQPQLKIRWNTHCAGWFWQTGVSQNLQSTATATAVMRRPITAKNSAPSALDFMLFHWTASPRIWVVEVELWSFLTLCGGAHVSHFPNPALVAVEMKIMIIMITPHWWRWSPWSSWSNLLAFHLRLAELKVVARRALPTTLLCVWNLVFIIFSGKSW